MKPFFIEMPNLWACQTNYADKFLGILAEPILVQWVCFAFLQKTKPLYPNPKYLFGIWIWIWAAKNYGFSHCGTCVRSPWIWCNLCRVIRLRTSMRLLIPKPSLKIRAASAIFWNYIGTVNVLEQYVLSDPSLVVHLLVRHRRIAAWCAPDDKECTTKEGWLRVQWVCILAYLETTT